MIEVIHFVGFKGTKSVKLTNSHDTPFLFLVLLHIEGSMAK